MSQYIVSLIRTWVPIAIGWLIGQLFVLGVVLDDVSSEKLKSAITALVIALYYAGARWLETRYPNAGALLGYIRQPVYVDPKKTVSQQNDRLAADVRATAKNPPTGGIG